MKILVVGNGGREHALAWKLLQSKNVEQVICTPGNGGTATLQNCQNLDIAVDEFSKIAGVVNQENIALVVVGPEIPLALGITNYLNQHTTAKIFGPSKLGAQLEASKSWSKALMKQAGIPTAEGVTFTNLRDAKSYLTTQKTPIVVKADGLAAGKGVTVAATLQEAHQAVEELFKQNHSQVVIEECLVGEEVSVLALTDGITIRPLIAAQDHKRIGEGDTGNNTGGMGAYAPAPIVTLELQEKINQQVLNPILTALQQAKIDYRGVIYAGLMITANQEVKVLEFNCRFGDPETQAILPLLITPLDELLLACATQKLGEMPPIEWESKTSVCIVMAASGYPGNYPQGMEILGIETETIEKIGAIIFQAGTKYQDGKLVTTGGRVLGVTTTDEKFSDAIAKAYKAVEYINFDYKYYRRDIGYRVL